jgi:hypothetical protein
MFHSNLRRMPALLAVLLVTGAAGDARAVNAQSPWIDGNDLYEWCAGGAGKGDEASCRAYILGAADLFVVSEHEQGRIDCIPVPTKPREVIDIVVRWLAESPRDRHFVAGGIVVTAIKEHFGCP